MTSESEEISDITSKYTTVLNALIQQNYNVINDVYLDMFITHISGKSGEGNINENLLLLVRNKEIDNHMI